MKQHLLSVTIGFMIIGLTAAKGTHKVHCSQDWMEVEITLPHRQSSLPQLYLDGMKGYPDERCHATITDGLAKFKLSLRDIYDCGVTRVVNKITGKRVFYHKIILEGDSDYGKEIVSVKCIITGPAAHNTTFIERHRRDVLPVGFQEPEDLDITTMVIEKAPEPILGVAVRQGNEIVTGELNVSPGTPLSMEIFLDEKSAPVYGLGVTYMQVTDTKSQEETIIFNGCSVDPYLFENFGTDSGDFLSAKFRAFKFPESTYVQFRGTVNVCVDKCHGVQCNNGQTGYGRKKRAVIASHLNPNKVFEISMTTFIKVNYDDKADKDAISELEQKLKQLQIANQKLARNSRGSAVLVERETVSYSSEGQRATVEDVTTLTKIKQTGSSNGSSTISIVLSVFLLVLSLHCIV